MNKYKKKTISSAPAKVILFGEHFVLYNNPVIVTSINKRIFVNVEANNSFKVNIKSGKNLVSIPKTNNIHAIQTSDKKFSFLYPIIKCVKYVLSENNKPPMGLNILINSEIPYGEGLGSSAALCVATTGALYSLFSKTDKIYIYDTAKIMEQNIHANSSGIDCYVSTFGGLINYEPSKGFSSIKTRKKFTILIGTTGIKHSTAELVLQVKTFREKNFRLFKELSSKAKIICTEARKAMLDGNELRLGHLLTENQKLLSILGVSHPLLEKLIERCMDYGALGAKLTGAGGGGAIIALIPNKKNNEIISKISERESRRWMLVEFEEEGIVIN